MMGKIKLYVPVWVVGLFLAALGACFGADAGAITYILISVGAGIIALGFVMEHIYLERRRRRRWEQRQRQYQRQQRRA